MSQIHCTNCGNIIPDNSAFCPNCGQKVIVQQPQPQPQPQYTQQYQQPYQGGGNGGNNGNNGFLYGIIALLCLLLVGGGAYYFISSSNEKEEAQAIAAQTQQKEQEKQMAELKEKQEKLEEENKKLTEENAKKNEKVIVKEGAVHGAEHRAVSAGANKAKVVINGDGVRLRFAPSLNSGYLTWANGQTRSPKKGSRLEYVSQDGDWYEVKYLNHTFYVSKEFSYLEY